MPILDRFGNPIQTGRLKAAQTASVTGLYQRFADHPARGLTPQKLASILSAAEQGDLTAQAELGEDMEERDAHLYAELSKRKRWLLTRKWQVTARQGREKGTEKAVALASELLPQVPDLEDVMLDCLDAIGHGFACLEFEGWERGEFWLPTAIVHRPQAWFQLDKTTRTELRLRDQSAEGAELQPFGWIRHVHKAKSGYIARGGLHRILAWPYLFKNYSVRDLAEFCEIYGLPLRLGKYPSGASEEERATLLSAVVGIGHAAAGIIPEGMAIEFTEAAKGASDPYMAMIDWCERSESKAILGQVLSAEAKSTGLGSGVANLQGEVRRDIGKSDARQLAQTLSRDLIFPLLVLNGIAREIASQVLLEFDTSEPAEVAQAAESYPRLAAAGVPIPVSYILRKLKIPKAKDGEAVMGRPAQPVPPPGGKNPAHPAAQAALRASIGASGVPEFVDIQADRLEADADPLTTAWVDQVKGLLDQVRSLDELADKLLQIYPDLDVRSQARLIAEAFAAAAAAGRADITGGGREPRHRMMAGANLPIALKRRAGGPSGS
jgi:phage gp29-like protein